MRFLEVILLRHEAGQGRYRVKTEGRGNKQKAASMTAFLSLLCSQRGLWEIKQPAQCSEGTRLGLKDHTMQREGNLGHLCGRGRPQQREQEERITGD